MDCDIDFPIPLLVLLLIIIIVLGASIFYEHHDYPLEGFTKEIPIFLQNDNRLNKPTIEIKQAGSDIYYYFYEKDGNKFLLKKIDASNTYSYTYIKESDESPKLIYKVSYFVVPNAVNRYTVNGKQVKAEKLFLGITSKTKILNINGKDKKFIPLDWLSEEDKQFLRNYIKVGDFETAFVNVEKILIVPNGTIKTVY